MKRLILAFLLLCVSAPAFAQTPTYKLAWDHLLTPAATAQTYAFTLKVDSAAAATAPATCTVNGTTPTTATCTTPLPTLAAGAHVLVLTAFADGTSIASDPYTTRPATKPIGVSITITIVIP